MWLRLSEVCCYKQIGLQILVVVGGLIMLRVRCAALAAVTVLGFGSIAPAADMPVKMPVKAPIVVYDPWVGLYAGVNIGYSWGNWSATNTQAVGPLGIFNFESTTASPKVNGILGGA